MTKEYINWILKRFLMVCMFGSAYLLLPHDISKVIQIQRRKLTNINILHKFDKEFGYDIYSMIVIDLRYALGNYSTQNIKNLIKTDNYEWLRKHRNSIAHGRGDLKGTVYYEPFKLWEIIKPLVLETFKNIPLQQIIWETVGDVWKEFGF